MPRKESKKLAIEKNMPTYEKLPLFLASTLGGTSVSNKREDQPNGLGIGLFVVKMGQEDLP
jgi:hypothetical protein